MNSGNVAKDKEYVEKFKNALADHVNEQTRKVEAHIKQIERLFTARKLRQLDDDLEDERGARLLDQSKKINDAVHTFDGVEGWLTREGVESLEVFSFFPPFSLCFFPLSLFILFSFPLFLPFPISYLLVFSPFCFLSSLFLSSFFYFFSLSRS